MGAIHIKALDHVVLRVADIDRAKAFYCDALGCTEERRLSDAGLVQLRAGEALIDLVDLTGEIGKTGGRAPGKEGRNLEHFCLNVDPFDASEISAHLESHGITPGEVKERYGADGFGPSMYISDPDGNIVELKGPPVRGPLSAKDDA